MITINTTIFISSYNISDDIKNDSLDIKKNDDICINMTIINNSDNISKSPCIEIKNNKNFTLIHNSMIYTDSRCPIPAEYKGSSKFILNDIAVNSYTKITFFLNAPLKTVNVDNLNCPIYIDNISLNNNNLNDIGYFPLLNVKESIVSIESSSKTIYMKNIGNTDINNLIFTYPYDIKSKINEDNITMIYGKKEFKDYSVKSIDNSLVFNIHHLSSDKSSNLLIKLEKKSPYNNDKNIVNLGSMKLN